MTKYLILIILITSISYSCNEKNEINAKTEVTKILNEIAKNRILNIKKIEIIDSSVVEYGTIGYEQFKLHESLKTITIELISLHENQINLLQYELEKLDYGFLSPEEIATKSQLSDQIKQVKKEYKSNVEYLRNLKQETSEIISNATDIKNKDSIIKIRYYLSATINNKPIDDTTEMFFNRNFSKNISFNNILYTGEENE